MIPPDDLRISPWPPGTVGGQHVGVPVGIQIEHRPTGTIARVCTNRSQHINKMIAMDMILTAITHPKFQP